MAEQPPELRSQFNPRGWSAGKILLLLAAAAVFVAMLTWDRGHFQQEQPPAISKPGSK